MQLSKMNSIFSQAMDMGQAIDLAGCCYGCKHGQFRDQPNKYYHFLAGFVRAQHLTYILDLGTHFGGSVKSMAKGLYPQDADKSRLVTVDETFENKEGFKDYPRIKRIQGDIISKRVIEEAAGSFGRDIDLMYIDSEHSYEHVKTVIYVYANRLKPKYIILDDIFLNDSMKKLWLELTGVFKDRAFDISDISGRGKGVGFGIIDWNHDFRPNWRGTDLWIKVYPLGSRILRLFH